MADNVCYRRLCRAQSREARLSDVKRPAWSIRLRRMRLKLSER